MEANPYSSPAPVVFQPSGIANTPAITEGIVSQLARTKPWVRFFSVLMYLASGFLVIMALLAMLTGGFGAVNMTGGGGAMGMGMAFGMGLFYLLFAGLYIYPAMRLWKYANWIGEFVTSTAASDLEAALNEQRAFWKFAGVAMITVFGLYLIFFVIVMFMAAAAPLIAR